MSPVGPKFALGWFGEPGPGHDEANEAGLAAGAGGVGGLGDLGVTADRVVAGQRWRPGRRGRRSFPTGRSCAIMSTQKVPAWFGTDVTSDITIVPAQEAFLVDAPTTTHSPHRWIPILGSPTACRLRHRLGQSVTVGTTLTKWRTATRPLA